VKNRCKKSHFFSSGGEIGLKTKPFHTEKASSREIKMRGKISFLISDWFVFSANSRHARILHCQ